MRTRKVENYEEKMELLLDDNRGIYIPQNFAQEFRMRDWGVSREQERILLDGPDNEAYWDVWNEVLMDAETRHQGHKWTLHQDGALWMVRDDMTEDEWMMVFESTARESVTIQDEVRIPGTNVILEKGDVIEILPKQEKGKKSYKKDEEDDEEEMDEKGDYKKKKKESRRHRTLTRDAVRKFKRKENV